MFLFFQLMPSPKWKLVVDIGELELYNTAIPATAITSVNNPVQKRQQQYASTTSQTPNAFSNNEMHQQMSQSVSMARIESQVQLEPVIPDNSFPLKDQRIDQLIYMLGEHMPSDPHSQLGSYMQGFMSLRLLLLRPSRSPADDEIVRIMLGSYSSYSSGGRAKNDIALMLARDFMFLTQTQVQPPQQQMSHQHTFHQVGQSVMMPPIPATSPYSFFGHSNSTNCAEDSFHCSPALAPIPMSGNGADNLSIVST